MRKSWDLWYMKLCTNIINCMGIFQRTNGGCNGMFYAQLCSHEVSEQLLYSCEFKLLLNSSLLPRPQKSQHGSLPVSHGEGRSGDLSGGNINTGPWEVDNLIYTWQNFATQIRLSDVLFMVHTQTPCMVALWQVLDWQEIGYCHGQFCVTSTLSANTSHHFYLANVNGSTFMSYLPQHQVSPFHTPYSAIDCFTSQGFAISYFISYFWEGF